MGSLYGFEIESELPLRRLNRAQGTRGTLSVVAAGAPLLEPESEPIDALEDDTGRRWYASYETEAGYLLTLPPTGSFLLEPLEQRVTVDARDGDLELLEHRLASSAICTLLAMRGDLVLHASAVQVARRAVLFCGPTGRGKSTLARTLGEAGHPVLGEDGVAVELGEDGPVVYPGARGIRVRVPAANGGANTDLVADPAPGEPTPCSVAAVALLGERGGESLSVEPLEPPRALALLTSHLVHSGSREEIAAAFERLARLLHTVPAFRAGLPDDLAALPAAAPRLIDTVCAAG